MNRLICALALTLSLPALAASDGERTDLMHRAVDNAVDNDGSPDRLERRTVSRRNAHATVTVTAPNHRVRVGAHVQSRPAPPPPPPTRRSITVRTPHHTITHQPGRPGSTRVASTHRPPPPPPMRAVVTHPAPPPRRVTVVHTAPRPPAVVVTHVQPHHGVLVYGPRPATHVEYVHNETPVVADHLPTRAVDRKNNVALGVTMGSMLSGYREGSVYGDFGMGVVGRYRPIEFLGLELGLSHHNQNFSNTTERSQTLVQGSAQLFLFPWGRVQPFATVGVTYNQRALNDQVILDGDEALVQTKGALFGPHAGVGLEFAIGQHVAIDIEARYTAYVNKQRDDVSLPGSLQTTGGLLFYF